MEGKSSEKDSIEFPEIAKELRRMRDADQAMRRANLESGEWNDPENIDPRNTERLKEIINLMGWPTISKVGTEASEHAWLLAQHADHDVTFQGQCLELLKAAPAGEVNNEDIAYLEDRVRINRGEKQLYGTQFYNDPVRGDIPKPLEDEENVDERRKAMGLEDMETYKKSFEEKYKEFDKNINQ